MALLTGPCDCCGADPAPIRYDGLQWCSSACALDECEHGTGAKA